jgi:cobalt-precorrin 5A hydrolase
MDSGKKVAVIAITRNGARLGARIVGNMPRADLKVMARYADAAGGVGEAFHVPIQQVLSEAFFRYDGLVLIMSLGAVVRLIAPLLKDKRVDPAVVVVDDAGRYAISALSGHLGGANRLAEEVAAVLGATPVITTASDANRTIAVDLLGREFGWTLEIDAFVTAASAAVVNGDPVAIWQTTGERGWWRYDGPLPANLKLVDTVDEILADSFGACLLVTDLILEDRLLARLPHPVVYRPKSLVAGVGCNRGTGADEIRQVVTKALEEAGLSPLSLAALATVDIKRDEEGMLEAASALAVPICFFTREELDGVECPNPSEAVARWVGTRGVAEPAAVLASGGSLIVPKRKSGNVTVAIARKKFEEVGR